MTWEEKKLLPPGEHMLLVQFCRFIEGKAKVSVIHQPFAYEDHAPIVRTFTQRSKALGDYTEKVGGKRKEIFLPEDRELLEGKIILGVIKEGRNSKYRDLVHVIRCFDPKELGKPDFNINAARSVTDRRTE